MAKAKQRSVPDTVEVGDVTFIVEEAGSVVLWKPVSDPQAKRKARAKALAVKRILAKSEHRSLEEIMSEIRGRPW